MDPGVKLVCILYVLEERSVYQDIMPEFSTILNKVPSKMSQYLCSADESIHQIRVKKKANPQSILSTERMEHSEHTALSMQTSKARTLLKATLQTDMQVKESMCGSTLKRPRVCSPVTRIGCI